MNINESTAYVFDSCGEPGGKKLSTSRILLAVLSAFDFYNSKLSFSTNSAFAQKKPMTVSAQEGGVVDLSNVGFNEPEVVMRRLGTPGQLRPMWEQITKAQDIEDLRRAETRGEKKIYFYGKPLKYILSWKPNLSEQLELWGKAKIEKADKTPAMAQEAMLPEECQYLPAVRATIAVLDDLLLPPDGNDYLTFVRFRKETLAAELQERERIFDVWRSNAHQSTGSFYGEPYNPLADLGTIFDL